MRVIGYIRVSTAEQARDGVSLDTQRKKIEGYAALYDLQLLEVLVDAGASAKTLKRPELQRALRLLKENVAEGLVIAKLDRLSRSVKDWNTLIEEFFGDRRGKELFSVGDSIDTRTAAGRLVLNVLMAVAQWEREAIAERTRDALAHKVANGERCGKIRFGFDLGSDGRTLEENSGEQVVIRFMQGLRANGQTFRQIALELTLQEMRTKEGKAVWTHTAVRRILMRDTRNGN